MIPILFESTATQFRASSAPFSQYHGLGELTDTISCEVTMASDGMYELELEYPTTGRLFTELAVMRRIIYASANQVDNPQAFRIYAITRQINGRVRISAKHVSYDLEYIPVDSFFVTSAQDFAFKIGYNALVDCPFTFQTDANIVGDFQIPTPRSARALLVSNGSDNYTWTGLYNGHIVFDNFVVNRVTNDIDRHLYLRYGKDIVDTTMEENMDTLITGVLPFYSKDGTKILGDVVPPQTGTYSKIKTVDVTEYFSAPPAGTDEQKKAQVEGGGYSWLNENGWGMNEKNLKLTYAQIDQTLRLLDWVTVVVERVGISENVQVCKTVWDSLAERYTSVEFGNVRTSLAADLSNAKRLTKGELSPDRIKNGSIGSGKLSGGVQSKLNTMVTNPFNGTFETSGLKYDGFYVTWRAITYATPGGGSASAYVLGQA